MRSFEEIIKDCIETRTTSDFNKYVEELLKNSKVRQMINHLAYDKRLVYYKDYLSIEDKVEECIFLVLCKANSNYISKFANFQYAVVSKIRDELKKEKKQLRYDETDSFDESPNDNSSIKLEDKIAANNKSVEENAQDNEKNNFRNELNNIGIKINTRPYKIMLYIYDIAIYNQFDNLHDLVILVNKNFQNEVKELLMYCAKKSKKIRKMFSSFFSFSIYEKFIEYILKPENKKLKISELIMDFNKIRNYLSILFLDDNINNKATFIEKCNWKKISSYEKEIHRILSLFNTDKNIFEFKNELKQYSPNKLSKIYEIHTVPNLVANFLILDILQQYSLKENGVKLAQIVEILFPDNYQDIKLNDKNNFRKYTLLPRLKEMEKYGFISINKEHKDRYTLNAKFLNSAQKNVLKYVVPFFCGIYPYPSIGHFLANRLDIKDVFRFESYNICNTLDDCVLYDLLKVINNKDNIKKLLFKNGNIKKDFKPSEIFIDNKTKLLKVKDDNNEYYLHEISEIDPDKKSNNLIFSEIYSFYYKIFEDAISQYNKNKESKIIGNMEKKDFTSYIPEKYSTYKYILNKKNFNELFQMLVQLKNIAIPLTLLEQRWLKTIMQDVRFDLFVSEDEKHSLENLVEDVMPFDLSAFKIYDNKTETYKSITTFGLPKGEDRDSLKKKLKEFNSVLYSIQNNTFDFNCKKA